MKVIYLNGQITEDKRPKNLKIYTIHAYIYEVECKIESFKRLIQMENIDDAHTIALDLKTTVSRMEELIEELVSTSKKSTK